MIQVYTVNAFTQKSQGGNPAGVMLNADHLTEEAMQSIANQVGFSETAFISTSEKADYKIRFFTPKKEVDLCGHATIASFHLLLEQKKITFGIYKMETKAGILSIECSEDLLVSMQQNCPQFDTILAPEIIAPCLQLEKEDFSSNIQIVSTGLRKIFAPVNNLQKLEKIIPNYDKIISISKEYNCLGIYAFTLQVPNATARCRNFAPLYGIYEDAATGTSAAALTCYLFKYRLVDISQQPFSFQQGYSINEPSEIITKLSVENETITNVEAAGRAFTTGKKNIQI